MTCSLASSSLYIQAIARLHNFIIDNDSLPERYGQPANINANGEFDDEELEALGIQCKWWPVSTKRRNCGKIDCR
jgi:hypothetical protein